MSFEHPKIQSIKDKSEIKKAENSSARNILLEIIEQHKQSFSELSEQEILASEKLIDQATASELSLKDFLENIGYGDFEFNKIGADLYEIPIPQTAGHQKLENGYGYKGGAARSILLRTLGIDPKAEPRDIDLVRITDRDINEMDLKMAEKYSPEDLAHSYGVEPLKHDYFKTRDFTINELLVVDDKIYLTKQCLLDTIRGIIRFCDFQKKELYDPEGYNLQEGEGYFVKDKLLAKALRFIALSIARDKEMELADKEIYSYLSIEDFHLALHLDRALEQGYDVAVAYLEQLKKTGQIDSEIVNPHDFILNFIKTLESEDIFIFRSTLERALQAETSFLENKIAISSDASVRSSIKHYLDEDKYGRYDTSR